MRHTAALGYMFTNQEEIEHVICLENAPKTNNSDHVFNLQRVVLYNADVTVHA